MAETSKTYTVNKVSVSRPSMNTPTIKILNEAMSITDTLNGSFLGGYKIYVNGLYNSSVEPTSSIDLGTLELPYVGRHKIKIRAFSQYFNDSEYSNEDTLSMKGYYTVANELGSDAILQVEYTESQSPFYKSATVAQLVSIGG